MGRGLARYCPQQHSRGWDSTLRTYTGQYLTTQDLTQHKVEQHLPTQDLTYLHTAHCTAQGWTLRTCTGQQDGRAPYNTGQHGLARYCLSAFQQRYCRGQGGQKCHLYLYQLPFLQRLSPNKIKRIVRKKSTGMDNARYVPEMKNSCGPFLASGHLFLLLATISALKSSHT